MGAKWYNKFIGGEMKVQTFGRLFKLEAKKMVGAKGVWLFIAMFVALVSSLLLRCMVLSQPKYDDAAINIHLFEVLFTMAFNILGYVVAPLLIFKNLFFDDLKQKVIQLYVGAGYSRRQLFMTKSVVVVLSTLVVCLLMMTYQMLQTVIDYNLCSSSMYICSTYESIGFPMVTALLNFVVLFIVEITIIYLALGSFLIKLNGLNVILHVVYSCILSVFVAGILLLLMAGAFGYNFEAYICSIPVFLVIANSIPLLYIVAMSSGSMVIEDAFFRDYLAKPLGSEDYWLFGIACACILIVCIYYVVKAWIMFNKKDF